MDRGRGNLITYQMSIGGDLFPFGVYDTKKYMMCHIGLYENEDECWRVYLGWPTRGEVRWYKEQGLKVVPLQVQYKP